MLEQSLHVSALLELLLLEIDHLVSHGFLLLCVILQSTLHGGCSFFDGFEPEAAPWSLLGNSPASIMVLGISCLLLFFLIFYLKG